MSHEGILVVDDEKNIRMTLTQALEDVGLPVDTAVNGEEALAKIEETEYRLILLDLKMPGIDGLEVLRRISRDRPEVKFIIITAHGTVESAVEAMKLGAVDFLQKPFNPNDIRELVHRVLDRENIDEQKAAAYHEFIELAKMNITRRRFEAAEIFLNKAAAVAPKRPEVFNLLGVMAEISGDRAKAADYYRSGYWIDPTYEPARKNLERVTEMTERRGRVDMGGPETSDRKK
jgi:DNA-binding NtrC family response regulator